MKLLELFRLGGVFMYPLLAFFVVMIYAIIERALFYMSFCWEITDNPTGSDYNKKSLFCTAVNSLYEKLADNPREFDAACTNECEKICDSLKSGLSLLSAVAAIAPITGFLGTVTGMIAAFREITNAVNVSTQLVAGGIYEALITTAAGLIISIIASIFYFWYSSLVSGYVRRMQNVVNDIVKEQYIRLCSLHK